MSDSDVKYAQATATPRNANIMRAGANAPTLQPVSLENAVETLKEVLSRATNNNDSTRNILAQLRGSMPEQAADRDDRVTRDPQGQVHMLIALAICINQTLIAQTHNLDEISQLTR